MRRREFITLAGGAAAWPLVAFAQQSGRMRRIGVLNGGVDADDLDLQARIGAFQQGFTTGEIGLRLQLRGSNPEPLMSALGH